MSKKDNKIVNHVVKKVLEDFDFEIDDVLESKKEDIEQAVHEEVLDCVEELPSVDWISLVELDEAEAHKNKNGDFLSN
ncbi:MAG: hypothetical protein ISS93_02955 [Candidatus Aenigmarchaeota archaeon]|nr:hypothetical protein [Candidatus Aenigmarchaeota archaeon]